MYMMLPGRSWLQRITRGDSSTIISVVIAGNRQCMHLLSCVQDFSLSRDKDFDVFVLESDSQPVLEKAITALLCTG